MQGENLCIGHYTVAAVLPVCSIRHQGGENVVPVLPY
jgi:hypothetical protein